MSRLEAKAEAELAAQQRKEHERVTQAAQQAHERTLSYMCHELRNPLHVISASLKFAFQELQRQAPDISAVLADVKQCRSSSAQLHRLVNDVLDLRKTKMVRRLWKSLLP